MTVRMSPIAGLLSLAVCTFLGQLALTLAPPASACDVPVYEYLLQRWARGSYRIYYLHSGREDPADRPVNEYLERLANDPEGHSNIRFKRLDVGRMPPQAPSERDLLRGQRERHKLPFHVVLTPHGRELFAGRLSLSDAKGLTHSPKREDLAKQLSGGKNGLLLLLLGGSMAESEAARQAVHEAIESAREYELDVGTVEVNRQTAAEQWLVRQLLAVREGLDELDEPMVFAVFGRGHVEPPHVGQGITALDLLDVIAFMNGPCLCTMNVGGTGEDLLTDWDWEGQLDEWAPGQERASGPRGYVTF